MAKVWISAASPLLTYSPSSSDWDQQSDGSRQYQEEDAFTVEVEAIFSDIAFVYDNPSADKIQVGLDGSSNQPPAKSDATNLSTTFGSHTATLQIDCTACRQDKANPFTLQGVELTTQVVESGSGYNATLDDTSDHITYTGFHSSTAPQSDIAAIQKGQFQHDTVSYTSAGGASAAFSVQGSAFFVFGMTGPGFGSYEVKLNNQVAGVYNASSNIETYNTLLFFTTYLDANQKHQVVITNLNDGCLFALDYISYVLPGLASSIAQSAQSGTQTSTSATTPGAAAVFPTQSNSSNSNTAGSGDNGGAVIGGVLGALAGLFLLWICWKYRQWKKAGGEGSFMVALWGGMRVKKQEQQEKNKFHLWLMVWARPKYAT
ncbi:uncharacterized protein I303_100438 [Kwoniella dejecticola CBS 10117]|uniref:Uncharacterized protein n=1 Tax=Kwoniella dejecticola CBS 10117 TaxID=1296121 RepID=A0A1A6AEX2_9TREE|nr:uncharacterized protein I303_00437 [Kwoniella dejecticola CBS 10117]OBR88620.1 hypothetical protein I303_00437 [Kwoniella dejecticola CBS 10117]